MKKTIIAGLSALIVSPAFAGNLDNPWERPPVMEPPQVQLTWGGFYGGVGVTTQKKTTRTTVEEPDGYSKKCVYGSAGSSTHTKHKCYVNQHDWNNSPELTALPIVDSPWRNASEDVVRYGGNGIWLGDHEDLSFSSTVGNDGDYRGAPEFLGETFLDIITLDEDEEVTPNFFAGYRHVLTNGFAMGIEAGSVGGLEGQIGVSQGRMFAYTGFNSDQEMTLGADFLVGNRGMFVGAKAANGEGTRGELRVGWSF